MKRENVVMISGDTSLLDDTSRAFNRHKKYAKNFNKLTIFVLKKQRGNESKTITIVHENLVVISIDAVSGVGYFKALMVMIRCCKKEKVDVITAQNPFLMGLLGIYLKHKFGIPLNIQIHTECFSNPYFRRESITNYLSFLLGGVVCRRANSLRFVSKRECNFVDHRFKEHIFIPEDFNSFFHKKEEKKYNKILYVGRLSREKNIPLLINAFKKLKTDLPRITLKIVGDGDERSSLVKLVKEQDLEKDVLFTGQKNKKELKELLRTSDFLVLPSFYEGWGLVCNEALASGIPVIMTETGCANTLVIHQKTGLVVPINNLNALVDAMKEMYDNDKMRYELGRRGQELVKQKEFSQEYIKKQWIQLLKDTARINEGK